MKIRPRTTLSGFGLMLLADAARVFDLRGDTGQMPGGAPAPMYTYRVKDLEES